MTALLIPVLQPPSAAATPPPQENNVSAISHQDTPLNDLKTIQPIPRREYPDGTEQFRDALKQGQSNIMVAVRVRPLLSKEIENGSNDIIRVIDGKVVVVLDSGVSSDDVLRVNRSREKRYAFDYAFGPDAMQKDLYEATAKFLIEGILNGFNATVFAYGPTGSGKTYTMLGTQNDPGIMFLTLRDLFEQTRQNVHQYVYRIVLSYLEVYNETIRDLLAPSNDYLDIREDPTKGMKVAGITEIEANSIDRVMELLETGNLNRTQEATAANAASSRSHAVLQIVVEQRDRTLDVRQTLKIGKLSMIDLAGSERASHTQNRGIRMIEGANINRSLLALGNCINALGEKHNRAGYVPYRDSKLTRLLKDSLGGNCRTVMIANINPSDRSVEETTNTLKYANRAKNIKTKVKRNVLSVSYHISQYTKVITELRNEINELKLQLAAARNGINGNLESQEFCRLREQFVNAFEERIGLRTRVVEIEGIMAAHNIECSRRQLEISMWEADNTGMFSTTMGSSGSASTLDVEEPKAITRARKRLVTLAQNLRRNAKNKQVLKHKLRKLDSDAKSQFEQLYKFAITKDRKEMLEFELRTQMLTFEKLDLEAACLSSKCIDKQKDQEIERLQFRLHFQERIIELQREQMKQNGVPTNVPDFPEPSFSLNISQSGDASPNSDAMMHEVEVVDSEGEDDLASDNTEAIDSAVVSNIMTRKNAVVGTFLSDHNKGELQKNGRISATTTSRKQSALSIQYDLHSQIPSPERRLTSPLKLIEQATNTHSRLAPLPIIIPPISPSLSQLSRPHSSDGTPSKVPHLPLINALPPVPGSRGAEILLSLDGYSTSSSRLSDHVSRPVVHHPQPLHHHHHQHQLHQQQQQRLSAARHHLQLLKNNNHNNKMKPAAAKQDSIPSRNEGEGGLEIKAASYDAHHFGGLSIQPNGAAPTQRAFAKVGAAHQQQFQSYLHGPASNPKQRPASDSQKLSGPHMKIKRAAPMPPPQAIHAAPSGGLVGTAIKHKPKRTDSRRQQVEVAI